MGQYYKAILLDKDTEEVRMWFESWDYDNGAKLMEHSYIGNPYVMAVEYQLLNTPMRVIWAGDYADPESEEDTINMYQFCDEDFKHLQSHAEPAPFLNTLSMSYLRNHTTGQYVRLSKLPKDGWGFAIHPLPLLTAEGNGRGGGDYQGINMEYVGAWARDVLDVSHTPKGFEKLDIHFMEDREKY